MTIVITKRVSLDFLGDEYKESYLVFKSIPLKDYETMIKQSDAVAADNSKALEFIQEQIESRFIEGKINGQVVAKEDLLDLPGEVFVQSFQALVGNISPKV